MPPAQNSKPSAPEHEEDLLVGPVISERECRGCTLCCKLLAVPTIGKPAGVLCRDCSEGKGCIIYRYRPGVCRSWNCAWRLWAWLGEEWYPLRSNMVINPKFSDNPAYSAIEVHVSPDFEQQWRKPEYLSVLRSLARRGTEGQFKFKIIINIGGTRRWIVLPDTTIEFDGRGSRSASEDLTTCWRCGR